MSEWLSGIGPVVGNHLWQSTAFAVAVWVATLLLRKNQARVRYGLWLAASVKFLIPFSLLVALGGMLPRPQRVVAAPAVYSAVDGMAQPFAEGEYTAVAGTHISEARHGAPELVAGVWLCGLGVVLVVWAVRWRQVYATLRRAVRVDAGREVEILRRVEGATGGSGRIRTTALLLSRELMEPGIFGIFRPVLIWPEQLSARLDDEHIEAILAHEGMHARRRDNLTAALHMVVEAVFWFHPLVWWMERRMVEERERACDEAVVAMGRRPEAYAESLLRACRFCVESPLTCVAGISGANLKQRVVQIMTGHVVRRLTLGKKLLLAAVALCTVAAPIVLGQAKAARRLMVAAIASAPRPFRVAAAAMIPEIETPATGEIAEAAVQQYAVSEQANPMPGSMSSHPCVVVEHPPIEAGPEMSQYSADRENAMASAIALENCHDYADAFPLYLKVLEKYPDDARALMLAADDGIQAGLIEESVPLLRRAIVHSPGNRTGNLRLLLMQQYIKLGEWKELETERLDTRRASLAGDLLLPRDNGYVIEDFSAAAHESIRSKEFPSLHGPDRAREQFVLLDEKDTCTGFIPHIDLELPDGNNVFSLYAYPTADSRKLLNSYPNGEPTYQTIRGDVLSALSKGPLTASAREQSCDVGPQAGKLLPVTFHLQTPRGSAPLKVSQVLLNGQPIALDTPVPVSGMWLRNIGVVLENDSSKNVVETSIMLMFTDTGKGPAGPFLTLSPRVGNFPERAFLQRDGTNKQIPASIQGPPIDVAPGRAFEISMDGSADSVQSLAYAKAQNLSNVVLLIQTVYFEDGSKWSGGVYYVPAPLPQVWKSVTFEEFR